MKMRPFRLSGSPVFVIQTYLSPINFPELFYAFGGDWKINADIASNLMLSAEKEVAVG
jgi:hypothetical protein